MAQQHVAYNSSQLPQPSGDHSKAQQDEEMNNQQFSWITDTIVVNGNPVRVIFPNEEETN